MAIEEYEFLPPVNRPRFEYFKVKECKTRDEADAEDGRKLSWTYDYRAGRWLAIGQFATLFSVAAPTAEVPNAI